MANRLKTIIVDDEKLARRGLINRLNEASDIEIVAEADNGRAALGLIRQHDPDLVFLDVQMPVMDGFDVLRALPPENLPAIVFVTGLDDFAIRAFQDHALDYVLKPLQGERLTDVLGRARLLCEGKQARKHRKSLLDLVGQITRQATRGVRGSQARTAGRVRGAETSRLVIRDGGRTTWLQQRDIEWIDAAGDYMCVHAGGETHIMRKTMKQLEQELDPAIFQRVHRSTIVNVHRVSGLQPHINGEYFLTLKGGHTVKLSRSYKDKLRYLD